MQYIRLNSSCETQIILTEILEINKTHTHTHTHIHTHTPKPQKKITLERAS